jgi:hypothetical protein
VNFQISFILSLFSITSIAQGDDMAVALQLESLGGKVVQKSGMVTEVSFRDSSKLGGEEWNAISQLSGLRKLTVYGGAKGLNDETVSLLAMLKQLESLSVDGAQLSDEGLAKLANVESLKSVAFFHLSFRKEGFTGKGFSAWKSMPQLEKLTVAGMSMGDEGFAAIAEISTLTDLRTWHTYRTNASHRILAKLPNLKSLKIGQRLPGSGRPVCLSDESMADIAKLSSLVSLEIGEGRFSFEALKQLKALSNLKSLKIVESEVTPAAVEQLRAELPAVEVKFENLTEEQRERLNSYLK